MFPAQAKGIRGTERHTKKPAHSTPPVLPADARWLPPADMFPFGKNGDYVLLAAAVPAYRSPQDSRTKIHGTLEPRRINGEESEQPVVLSPLPSTVVEDSDMPTNTL